MALEHRAAHAAWGRGLDQARADTRAAELRLVPLNQPSAPLVANPAAAESLCEIIAASKHTFADSPKAIGVNCPLLRPSMAGSNAR
jgi:hypothetical protein